ncbi:hypothetical protein R6Q59_007685 [Mikania micrantha]
MLICLTIGSMFNALRVVGRSIRLMLVNTVLFAKKMSYNLQAITCVLFDDDVVALLDITTNELISKPLTNGRNDPLWLSNYLLDSLCARSVIFRIKIDKYNLAHHYVRGFTVSKYVGENMQLLANESITSTTSTSTPVMNHDVSCIMDEEDKEFLLRIATDEWKMADEAFWATCYSYVSTVVSTSSSVTIQNQAGMNIVTPTQDLHSDDATTFIS